MIQRKATLVLAALIVMASAPALRAGLNVGDQAADFTLTTQWSTQFHLYENLGRVVVINFSALW